MRKENATSHMSPVDQKTPRRGDSARAASRAERSSPRPHLEAPSPWQQLFPPIDSTSSAPAPDTPGQESSAASGQVGFHISPPGVSAAQALILDCTIENQEWRSLRVARASGKRPVPAGVTRGGLKGGWDKWREGVMGFNLPFIEAAACVQPKLKSACPSPLFSSPLLSSLPLLACR